jgi:flagellar FliL protein
MADAGDKQLAPVAETEEAPPKKKKKLKRIIILVLILAVLGGGGFFAWKFFLKNMFFGPEAAEETAPTVPVNSLSLEDKPAPAQSSGGHGEGAPALPPLAPAPALLLTMDPFMVNLADNNARRFLRVIVAIDVETEEMQKEVQARMPRIRDSLLLLFSSKTSLDLNGPQGRLRLRMEILKTINNDLGISNKITKAFYMEFLIQ